MDFDLETRCPAGPVAGLDEAGRGPLAGPVVAAAVVVPEPQRDAAVWREVGDSKKLTRRKRAALAPRIEAAAATGLGRAEPAEIDRLNILQASFLAMQRALAALPEPEPGYLLVDGNRLPAELPAQAEALPKGDTRCVSIAAASILAKLARDREMAELDRAYPGYGFARNQGYPTAEHRRALAELGPTPVHRQSFIYQPALPL